MRAPRRPSLVVLATALAVTGCSGTGGTQSGSTSDQPSSPATSTTGTQGSSSSSSAPPRTPGPVTTSSGPASPDSTRSAATGCADRVLGRLTPEQRAGQLLMVGLQAGREPSSIADLIQSQHVGSVIYLGGWEGTDLVRRTSGRLQSYAPPGLRLIVAADQEGGRVWQLRDPGTPRLPSAREQGTASPAQRRAYGEQIGRMLKSSGVNLNLAPVADTVPEAIGRSNQPIGRWEREYGSDPEAVARAVPDVVRGLHAGGVGSTVKHFPGIGRITGNTDFSATGIDDPQATRNDPHLKPFRAGIAAGADAVMVSSARYPRLDPAHQALFSRSIVTDLLRESLWYDGVVVTDDLAARALEGTPTAERATRFVAAGGDLVLTGRAGDARPMLAALVRKAASDPTFRQQVDASARRVIALKARRGLVACR